MSMTRTGLRSAASGEEASDVGTATCMSAAAQPAGQRDAHDRPKLALGTLLKQLCTAQPCIPCILMQSHDRGFLGAHAGSSTVLIRGASHSTSASLKIKAKFQTARISALSVLEDMGLGQQAIRGGDMLKQPECHRVFDPAAASSSSEAPGSKLGHHNSVL